VPFLAVYSASKAYVRFFSRCLSTEYVVDYFRFVSLLNLFIFKDTGNKAL